MRQSVGISVQWCRDGSCGGTATTGVAHTTSRCGDEERGRSTAGALAAGVRTPSRRLGSDTDRSSWKLSSMWMLGGRAARSPAANGGALSMTPVSRVAPGKLATP
jgi:hypothetical protein